jgi:erythromycin esterase
MLRAFPVLIATAACILTCIGQTGMAGESPSDKETYAAQVDWLKNHVAPLKSIDPADEDFADLEPIRAAIGDSRIVELSEQSHGDGATFHARTRLIKFLHQNCGFDVLAFESGFYDCRKAWELLRQGRMSPRQAISYGVFDIWTSSEQVQPLIDYLGQQSRTSHPLEICGFDCQFSAPQCATYLGADLDELLRKLPPDLVNENQRVAVVRGCKRMCFWPDAGIDREGDAALAVCRQALAGAQVTQELTEGELLYWRQFFESVSALAKAKPALRTRPSRIEDSYGNIRDPQMARNFVWLAEKRYPKHKIIVWAAAFHLLRHQQQVAIIIRPSNPGGPDKAYPYVQIATMNNEVDKVLHKQIYSIFFTAAEGDYGSIRVAKPIKIASPLPGSLEDLLVKAGIENGFLDVRHRGSPGAWLEERRVARVLGHADYEADWTQVFDGLIFTRRMYASTPIKRGG